MTSPVIVPMRPGERPTEAGWYVAEEDYGLRHLFHVIPVGKAGPLHVFDTESVRAPLLSNFDEIFIARIYPERIEGKTEG